ncbi:hypothetical protein C6P46_005490 [Rhodotorula mucilaginosa]|uniref:Uncharacterized protein n=1 Tax=Rhodotorula mucilaginosa TaxID=5537 RepID=A0A9P6W8U9_RHOMI|nr:hypothetical protein C6P46_005490 [Rhodotorula mucilaginosa]TKA55403.1 hypothetical protein B0A53_02327 [Rhodotorula sp. CCFEE 5036]
MSALHLPRRGLLTVGLLSFMAGSYARLMYQRAAMVPRATYSVDVSRSGGGI